ncbi:MAG TPA: polysaccharide deacetylase family protein [Polyangia bacterium]|jgi:peptidoglycan/xylan/chitin deacetylase (PgdA/CDA1 family)|nr:polysaccharide deacetylase family protein [Polyangia bacterium]
MKGWRQLRAAARATVHTALVAAPLLGMLTASSWPLRLFFAALTAGGLYALVWAAFVYIPGFDLTFRIPWRGPARKKRMAITFDDGPNGAATEEVLELFRRHQAKATFFLVGRNVEAQPALAQRIAREGHAVGSHTYSHAKLHFLPRAQMQEEIDRGHACLGTVKISSELFRAPHGLKSWAMARYLRARGLRLIAWTDGVFDTDCPSGEVIFRRALPKLRGGEILLLHDGKLGHDRRPMLDALAKILDACAARGLQLVTVPELLGFGAAPSANQVTTTV